MLVQCVSQPTQHLLEHRTFESWILMISAQWSCPDTISRVSFRTGLSEASIACVFWRAPCSLDIRREAESDPVSYVWTLDFGEGAFVVRQARIPFISCSEITKPCNRDLWPHKRTMAIAQIRYERLLGTRLKLKPDAEVGSCNLSQRYLMHP